ncbi:ParB N-terminal domain-containing protein [Asticcacaulis sp. EMRT-3]|uniref:ParB/RepB/Spo0J family partition protein n=1 Tax=Asticcacaulis sp. EMRT-3 TaxID=3040349 RepID=UPI0024AEDF2D|nr:ParB N-terminal domain-containing protein [Asticcacaulis sp. EMRT-3]MDI7776588.1 ParB N-terminal domain-containing protein [Asticcacaulis sp. EMRT-3]
MTQATQKIVLSTSRDIPLNKLVLSQSNVRIVKSGISIEELAEDIARRTLLQSLNVRPVLSGDGIETGMFEVPAGGRRYRALQLLVKQKRLAKDAPINCVVRAAGSDTTAEEDSLAENVQRVALHPLDQFRAFQALRGQGASEEEIAARFFVNLNVVQQRLRLASVSPALLEVYAEDGMTLNQLMAFSVSTDQVRQEQVWANIKDGYSKEPYHIKRLLTEHTIEASDRRALFVGVDAYEDAGGAVFRDLFSGDNGGWLQDIGLLNRLVNEKLALAAEAIAVDGWKWVEVAVDLPYGNTAGMREITGAEAPLTEDEQATIDALVAEQAAIEAKYAEDDEYPDEVDQRLGQIETALEEFDERPATFTPAERAISGVFLSLARDGTLAIERGWVRPEDELPADVDLDTTVVDSEGEGATLASTEATGTVITVFGHPSPAAADEDEETIRPLPDRLVSELTAYRTLALQDAIACSPRVAMTMLLHKLVTDAFRALSTVSCLEASVRRIHFPEQGADLKICPAALAITERSEAWKAAIPQGDQELWDWLEGESDDSRAMLLAYCVSFGVNALVEKIDRYGGGLSQHGLDQRIAQADRLATAVSLDLVEAGWRPTADNYLGRVTKPRILEAVREGAGDRAAQLIEHLKKGDMAKEAERLLANTGWLPEPLRLEAGRAEAEALEPEARALPEFLTNGEDGALSHATAPEQLAAAE